ncbi:PREDICTED: gastrotropin [Ceratotherium simum simum]|uniref:Gastrotropin n=1 Tax=Ceratotherium simum simum TaxID=73337 RepID=A0ABM0HK12_CERSS|nr:PREDICTED: gastrotropin [Ceratotherium simum simum]
MAFTGKYEIESEKNYDQFMTRIGLPTETTEKGRNLKTISEVQQDGQTFTWSQHYPGGPSITNKFTIGKESEMETMGGKKFKATVQMEGGKLVVVTPNYHYSSEIVDDKLVELSTVEGVTYERVSKRLA